MIPKQITIHCFMGFLKKIYFFPKILIMKNGFLDLLHFPHPREVKILGNWGPYLKLYNYALTGIARLFILQHAKLSSSIHTAYAMSVIYVICI